MHIINTFLLWTTWVSVPWYVPYSVRHPQRFMYFPASFESFYFSSYPKSRLVPPEEFNLVYVKHQIKMTVLLTRGDKLPQFPSFQRQICCYQVVSFSWMNFWQCGLLRSQKSCWLICQWVEGFLMRGNSQWLFQLFRRIIILEYQVSISILGGNRRNKLCVFPFPVFQGSTTNTLLPSGMYPRQRE